MLFTPSLQALINLMKSKNYKLYENADISKRSLNIVGIRNASDAPNKFDDTLAIFFLIPGASDLMYFPITTDPSPHYLKHPINVAGTAILEEGQYVDVYSVAMHSPPSGNSHQAICQRNGSVTVYRDNNRDSKLNYVNPQAGADFGINLHRGPDNGNWDSANPNYSAGCQVFADSSDFALFMSRCKQEKQSTGKNLFTYTLLNEKDF